MVSAVPSRDLSAQCIPLAFAAAARQNQTNTAGNASHAASEAGNMTNHN